MIRNTFLMLDGVGEKTEKLLWKRGILSWEDFLAAGTLPTSLMDRQPLHEEMITYFSHELERYNAKPFAEFIRKSDHWRLYRYFRDHSLCIDIETNGLPAKDGGEITVAGFYDGKDFRQYIKGINLDETSIFRELSSCKLIISFYGRIFDMPFLEKHFSSLKDMELPHYDLCFASRKAGFFGGLKKIEADLGLKRESGINKLNGLDAVKLWQKWETGDRKALDTLLSYNRADTVNLRQIADVIYAKLFDKSGFRKFRAKYSNQ
ncbi:hypothetical protein BMS3Abin07_01865 [bacterium BMS3Abin07]|nr:hypothetical protein BMS3Abin07_01865 [bacterium BMS3Abin07]GBE32038.1 hypothetical protein BMS3Bbin05_00946 [bacterium BMS3Bbin05]HDL20628.1 exonuclease [Nitrospirota bacterium]HDO22304.1 exonuclease [Nitrospirota bacterium]HDZ88646.1 exonuclease [Nitrospirota bacterium]